MFDLPIISDVLYLMWVLTIEYLREDIEYFCNY